LDENKGLIDRGGVAGFGLGRLVGPFKVDKGKKLKLNVMTVPLNNQE
jgi:hypothetical protein